MYRSNPERFTSADPFEKAAWELADEALVIVDAKFGPQGSQPKGYHNLEHSRDDVVDGVVEIADLALSRDKITLKDKTFLIIGAGFHDVTQELGSGMNEWSSAKTARSAMRKKAIFDSGDEDTVDRIIMATRVEFKDGVMRQLVPKGDFLAELLADADLSSLGRPWETYWERATGLFTELLEGKDPTMQDKISFIETQVTLLTNHEFYTEEARECFPHQAENLESVQAILDFLVPKT